MPNQTNQKPNLIEAILRKQSVLVLDGALATELESYGCDLNDPLWSAQVLIEKPEAIKRVHAEYFRAGADCAITASYQATIKGFAERGLSERESVELIQKTVTLAKEARDEVWQEDQTRVKPLVAASVGPYGAYLADGSEYGGNYGVTEETLLTFHRPRVEALVEAGADLLAFETIPSFQEAKVLASLLEEFPDTSAWLSFSLKDGGAISDGTGLPEVADEFEFQSQIVAIGVNCAPVDAATEAVKLFSKNTLKPIIVYPNSGETYDPKTKTWHGEGDCESFDTQSEALYKAGARLIGGCCRTTPEYIKALAHKWK
ncbi:homocysteine S-methyltransferase [Pseudalkalibacillus salsuginis]|uniref:homocysteine S-methyltransferase n=1 Tax=Pseudalkalibacillus salsuginis TaxID=2910972 RepID=UPI001F2764C4|nr:homocysteine S-methyltransferase [Pseudalkalibacillus salsuginis]MCF6411322.1 homocysteine S-methyltransferase [Pseudalkalibacillus salsuginis]